MIMKAHYILFALVALTSAACSKTKEQPEANGIQMTFRAYQEGSQGTKTTIQNGGTQVYWEPADEIKVFFNGTSSRFVSQNTEEATVADFSGALNILIGSNEGTNSTTKIFGLYPYREDAVSDGSSVTTTLPAEQTGRAGSFAKNTHISLAATNANSVNLGFYNVTGGLRFSLIHEGIKSVTFEGNNGENIAGKVKIAFADGRPLIQDISEGKSRITLTVPDGETFQTSQWYYFAAIPGALDNGFKMTFYKDGEYAVFTSDKAVSIKRGIFGSLTTPDKDLEWEVDEREALIAIYNALDGDHWLDNTNWCSDKPLNQWYGVGTNGSGRVVTLILGWNNLQGHFPVAICNLAHLVTFSFDGNFGLTGSIPNEISELKALRYFTIQGSGMDGDLPDSMRELTKLQTLCIHRENNPFPIPSFIGSLKNLKTLSLWGVNSSIPVGFYELPHLTHLDLGGSFEGSILTGIGSLQQAQYISITAEGGNHGSIPAEIGNLKNLKSLQIFAGLTGQIPEEIGELTNLVTLALYNNSLSGPIPSTIGNCTSLKSLQLDNNNISGPVPSSLKNCSNLKDCYLDNNCLSGEIPDLSELNNLNGFRIGYNNFNGTYPSWMLRHPGLKHSWGINALGNSFSFASSEITAPDDCLEGLNGDKIDLKDIYSSNKYTILYVPSGPNSDYLFDSVKRIYEMNKNKGVEVITFYNPSDKEKALLYENELNIGWKSVLGDKLCFQCGSFLYSYMCYPVPLTPHLTLVDNSGHVVSTSFVFDNDVERIINNELDDIPDNIYCSSDYSIDGVVTPLCVSSQGAGIPIVIMGDGFSDRQIESGLYLEKAQQAVDALFTENVFKSNKELFSIYCVNVVSRSEGYDYSGQALGTGFGDGTHVYGNDYKVMQYAKKALPETKLDDALVIVLMNKDDYAGTCYMYSPVKGDYGQGLSIAYFPISSDTDTFNGVVSHEAGGHGFAKLADEYAYDSMGAISADAIASTKVKEPYGWWKNVDFTSDPTQVKWSQFLSDDRYAAENLGCFEGGLTYSLGIWRPTENSIMRYNTGGFNAPSRYAIWYRIGKLAYGESWDGSYEDFVTYDHVNRTPAAIQLCHEHARSQRLAKPLPQLAPPVVIDHSWRDVLSKAK